MRGGKSVKNMFVIYVANQFDVIPRLWLWLVESAESRCLIRSRIKFVESFVENYLRM